MLIRKVYTRLVVEQYYKKSLLEQLWQHDCTLNEFTSYIKSMFELNKITLLFGQYAYYVDVFVTSIRIHLFKFSFPS